jgi:hypothetical protein
MKGTVRFPIVSFIVLIVLMTLLRYIRIPFVYGTGYRMGAWVAERISPKFLLPFMYCLELGVPVFCAAAILYILGWRPKKKTNAPEIEQGSN